MAGSVTFTNGEKTGNFDLDGGKVIVSSVLHKFGTEQVEYEKSPGEFNVLDPGRDGLSLREFEPGSTVKIQFLPKQGAMEPLVDRSLEEFTQRLQAESQKTETIRVIAAEMQAASEIELEAQRLAAEKKSSAVDEAIEACRISALKIKERREDTSEKKSESSPKDFVLRSFDFFRDAVGGIPSYRKVHGE